MDKEVHLLEDVEVLLQDALYMHPLLQFTVFQPTAMASSVETEAAMESVGVVVEMEDLVEGHWSWTST